jgi:hypothetical protein
MRTAMTPSRGASCATLYRFIVSRSDSAYGGGELPVGAPRIHGELLKLAIAISERTVRGICSRPPTRSQTWRAFFANHLGGPTVTSPMMFADARDDDVVVDSPDVSLQPTPCRSKGPASPRTGPSSIAVVRSRSRSNVRGLLRAPSSRQRRRRRTINMFRRANHVRNDY